MGSNPRLFLLLFALLPALVFGEHCPRFAERTDGEISYDPEDEAALRLGSIATLNCNNGNIRRSRCTSAGWKPQTFTRCEPVSRDESHNFGGISPPQAGGCPSITNLSNGFVVYSPMGLAPYRQDTLATLNCHLGFVNSGPQSARCEHGRWTELGSCETSTSQQCSQLPDVPNGQLSYIAGPKGPFAADSVAELSCKLGFSPVGNSRVKCGKTGWEPFPGIGRCEEKRSSRSKRQLGIGMNGQCTGLTVPNGQVNYIQANPSQPYASGTTAFVICNPGFSVQGAPSSYCTGNLWSPSLGSCQSTGGIGGIGNPGFGGIGGIGGQGTCPAMLAPLNGQLTYSMGGNLGPFPSGTTVSLVCQPGFVSNSGLTTASCQNSVWQPSSLGPCSPSNGLGGIGSPGFGGIGGIGGLTCPAAPVPLNGQLQYSGGQGLGTYNDGATVTLICNAGFSAFGSTLSTCRSGQWFPPLGTCNPQGGAFAGGIGGGIGGIGGIGGSNSCPLGIAPPLGGTVTYSTGSSLGPFNAGATATLLCNLGTTPAGPTTASCLGASGWSPPTLGPCNSGGAFGGIGGGIGAPGLGGIGGAGSCLAGILPPLNGRVTYSTGSPLGPYPSGTSATLTCDIGYTPSGQQSAYCTNGVFSPTTLGVCLSGNRIGFSPVGGSFAMNTSTNSSCFGLPTPANGRVSYSSFPNLAGAYPIATSAFVVCNLAFVPSNGQTIFSCLSNGWSSAPSSLASCVPANSNGGR